MPAVTKSITLQEEEPSLRVTFGVSRVGGDSRQRSDFAYFGALAPRTNQFFMKFQHVRYATGATMQTLICAKL